MSIVSMPKNAHLKNFQLMIFNHNLLQKIRNEPQRFYCFKKFPCHVGGGNPVTVCTLHTVLKGSNMLEMLWVHSGKKTIIVSININFLHNFQEWNESYRNKIIHLIFLSKVILMRASLELCHMIGAFTQGHLKTKN